jgi:predicted Zn-dependent protease
MIDQHQALSLLKTGLSASTADQTEMVLIGEDLSLTRFAESRIHQNMYRSDTNVYVRAIKDKKIGIASTGELNEDSIKRAVADACTISQLMPADEQFSSLPTPASQPVEKITTEFKETAESSPRQRADAVKKIIDRSSQPNLQTAGAFRTSTEAIGVVNSIGVEQFNVSTKAELSLTATGDKNNAGWAIGFDRDIKRINAESLATTAIDKALKSADPIAIDSGQYAVILEPAAVGQLLLFLAFMGFGGKSLVEKRSFMAGKIGEKICGENMTITEDPFHPRMLGVPFDYEGVPRQKVSLIEKGVAKGVVYNSYYANLAGVESTGHALPPNNSFGPYPKHMVIDAGTTTLTDMVKSTVKGIYITHFWYVNYLNPMKTMVTGTTRDGTFMIEDGVLTKPIKNMRISQSILEAFSNVDLISSERQLYPQYSVVMLVPALKIKYFTLEKTEG